MLPLQERGLGHMQRKEPLQVWCWRPIYQVGVLSAWLPVWPCLLLQSLCGHLWALFQPHFASTYPSFGSLLISISFIIWLPKWEETFPPLLITEFPTRSLHQWPSASQWALSFCLKRGAGEQSALSWGDTALSSLWSVPLGAGTFIYQPVTLTCILLLTAGSRRLLVSLLNFLYMFFF